jgi:hypothetical protein
MKPFFPTLRYRSRLVSADLMPRFPFESSLINSQSRCFGAALVNSPLVIGAKEALFANDCRAYHGTETCGDACVPI